MNDYGVCPFCGAVVIERERKPNGDDYCENGHVYPSSMTKDTKDDSSLGDSVLHIVAHPDGSATYTRDGISEAIPNDDKEWQAFHERLQRGYSD